MYICLCRGITNDQIREAVTQQGARCNRDLNQVVGVQPECGECGPHTREIIYQCCREQASTN